MQGATDATRPVRVAVCGEVSAGKSTVLNALLRQRLLPDNIGKSRRPVVHVGHRAEPGVEIEDAEGGTTTAEGPGTEEMFHEVARVQLWSDHEHLAGFEVIEVPLTKAEELTQEQIELIGSTDVLIWVTIASQAWRLTEKTIVEKLGKARPAHGILAVTRGDKLRTERDRTRLRERMERETDHFFQECIFINGARRKLEKAETCDKAFDETGGSEVLAAMQLMAEVVRSTPPVEEVAEEETPEEAAAPEMAEAMAEDSAGEPAAAEAEAEAEAAEEAEVVDEAEDEAEAEAASPDTPEAADSSDVVDFKSFRSAAAGQPDPQQAPEADDVPGIMTSMSSTSGGVLVLGMRPHDAPEEVEVTHGEEAVARELGNLCARLQQTLAGTLAATGDAGGVSAFNLSTQGRRILFNDVPGVGLLFLMADAAQMSQGSAQSFLARVSRRLEEAG